MSSYGKDMTLGDWAAFKKTVTHPFQAWESGAKELEKTAPGKIITAPIRLPAALIGASEKIITGAGNAGEKLPGIVESVPVIIGILAIGVAGYLIFAGRKGTKLTPF